MIDLVGQRLVLFQQISSRVFVKATKYTISIYEMSLATRGVGRGGWEGGGGYLSPFLKPYTFPSFLFPVVSPPLDFEGIEVATFSQTHSFSDLRTWKK